MRHGIKGGEDIPSAVIEEAIRQEDEIRRDKLNALRVAVATLANASGNLKRPAKPEDVYTLPGDAPKDNGFSALRRHG